MTKQNNNKNSKRNKQNTKINCRGRCEGRTYVPWRYQHHALPAELTDQ